VDAGLILIDTMRAIESPVYCVVESKAYSMAAIILTFCERRYALDHATIMLHEASYGTAGEDPSIRSRLDFLTRYLDLLHVQIAKQLGMPVDVYRARIRDAWWLMADEAKKAGVIDEVVDRIDYVTPATEQSETKTTVKLNHTLHDARPTTKGAPIKKRR
jgi:ATP-dependent Clp protease protease subunit